MTRLIARPQSLRRRYAVGAEVHGDGVHFRVWAPSARHVTLLLHESNERVSLDSETDGYWSGFVADLRPGMQYSYLLAERGPFPDPASRFQPEGPHGPS